MKKQQTIFYVLLLVALLFQSNNLLAQSNKIDHYEALCYPSMPLKYYTETQTPPTNWMKPEYSDASTSWKDGVNTIGFGGVMNYFGSTKTVISSTNTLYTRTKFNVTDTSLIEQLYMYRYIDDGFVVYLNGIECARANLGTPGSGLLYTEKSDSTYDFTYYYQYSENITSGIIIPKDTLRKYLKNGENLICIEQHNDDVNTDNMSLLLVLYQGLNTTTMNSDFQPCELDSTPLPIIILDVPGNFIPDDPRVIAKMKIIDNGSGKMNRPTDAVYTYDGKISIERRGSSSQMMPKHSYGLSTLNNANEKVNVPLMGLPPEHDWIFHGEMMDKTLIRDVITFHFARQTGQYASRTRFFELIVNGNHLGLFSLFEKVKRDSARVDISKLLINENAGDSLTGGYILKLDKTTGSAGGGFASAHKCVNQDTKPFFQYEYPEGDVITSQQQTYIQSFMRDFENSLRSTTFTDPATGYRKYIDVKSFIDYMIVQEIARNVDGYRLSTFMYKDRVDKKDGGRLNMGPVWDSNLAYGYSGTLCNSSWSNEGWGYNYNTDCPNDSYFIPFWWDRLLQDDFFTSELKKRWDYLRSTSFSNDSIMNYIDSVANYIEPAQKRNFLIWENMFQYSVWPLEWNDLKATSYSGEITYLKNFITNRLAWLDDNFPDKHEVIIYPTSIETPIATVFQVRTYPNPFVNEVSFEYVSIGESNVKISIYSATGQVINVLTKNSYGDETNIIKWNGNDAGGNNVKPGMYFYTLELNNRIVARNKLLKY
jgi:hypothetical protein